MKIIVDAMGGDNAPLEILRGCALAHKECGMEFVLTGNKDEIEKIINENSLDLGKAEIVHTDIVVSMEDEPTCVIKDKKERYKIIAYVGHGRATASEGGPTPLW
jgi:glycerol-3-phosphate acyltransferase PlsX